MYRRRGCGASGKGKHYGWPYCYTPTLCPVPVETKEVHDERVAFDDEVSSCDQTTPALFTDLADSAPIAVAQYNQTAFPADYQGNLFEAYHGSWNSSVAAIAKCNASSCRMAPRFPAKHS